MENSNKRKSDDNSIGSPTKDETSTKRRQKLIALPVLPFAPLRQDERQHYLKLLYNEYVAVKQRYGLKINPITKAVNKEFEIAKVSKQKMGYQMLIKKAMFNLKKYGNEDGKSISESNNKEGRKDTQNNDNDLMIKELLKMCIDKKTLVRNNFVMDLIPDDDNVEFVKKIDCAHCGKNFSIDKINEKVTCTFHPGKLNITTYNDLNSGKKIFGTDYTNRSFFCCNEIKGETEGCKQLEYHVFKLNDIHQLNKCKKFKTIELLRSELGINDNDKLQILRKEKLKAIGIDCEMCFTDLGFEMMKISIVDFTTLKTILDKVVYPDGDKIIDLNSNISGVTEIPKNSLTFDEVMIKLAELTDKDTIVVGHGLENDLNVLRLIYNNIVDTSILLSENQVNIRRKDPLKKLAWKYLSENIQGKEHDSTEDALIPIRIIKKVLQKKIDRQNSLKNIK